MHKGRWLPTVSTFKCFTLCETETTLIHLYWFLRTVLPPLKFVHVLRRNKSEIRREKMSKLMKVAASFVGINCSAYLMGSNVYILLTQVPRITDTSMDMKTRLNEWREISTDTYKQSVCTLIGIANLYTLCMSGFISVCLTFSFDLMLNSYI